VPVYRRGGRRQGQNDIFYTTGILGKRALVNKELRRKTGVFRLAGTELGLAWNASPAQAQRHGGGGYHGGTVFHGGSGYHGGTVYHGGYSGYRGGYAYPGGYGYYHYGYRPWYGGAYLGLGLGYWPAYYGTYDGGADGALPWPRRWGRIVVNAARPPQPKCHPSRCAVSATPLRFHKPPFTRIARRNLSEGPQAAGRYLRRGYLSFLQSFQQLLERALL